MNKIKANKSPIVMFDASINEKTNTIGIGIYEIITDSKTTITITANDNVKIDSSIGEQIALQQAVKWANNLFSNEVVHFFTDNMMVYKNQNYVKPKGKVYELFWVPRRFNDKADKLSKLASSKKQTSTKLKTELNTTPITDIQNCIKSYPLDRRFRFLKLMASNDLEMRIVEFFETGKNKPKTVQQATKFVKLIRSVLSAKEAKANKKEYFKSYNKFDGGMLSSLKAKEIEKMIRKRTNI